MDHARTVLDQGDVTRAIRRISHEIVESAKGSHDLVILGIPTRGVFLARRIASIIGEIDARTTSEELPVGALDVTLYRDDLRLRSVRGLEPTEIPVTGVEGKTVVLVDDVLYSGRTIRAALDALNDIGRPAAVRLAVLVDRGHRELPIRPDFVGKNIPTAIDEQVRVRLEESDGIDEVAIEEVTER